MITKNENPIKIKKGKIEITLALGIGSYNPDESKNIKTPVSLYKPWLKYENHWYFIKNYSRYNSLSDIAANFNNHKYSEEIFLECIFEHI